MTACENCGLAIKISDGEIECAKFGKICAQDKTENPCIYYMGIRYEDGEAMTPFQHLLLKEQELKERKMKGVI